MSVTGDQTSDIPERVLKILEPTEEEKKFRLKLYPDVASVEDTKILCTICQKDVKRVFLLKGKLYKHIFLRVAVCKPCLTLYGDGVFSTDEDGADKYCRWCGLGGTLCFCSSCNSSFCKECILRNLDQIYLSMAEKEAWKWFFCDPKPLYKLRAVPWAVDEYLKNNKFTEEPDKTRAEQSPRTPKVRATKSSDQVKKPQ